MSSLFRFYGQQTGTPRSVPPIWAGDKYITDPKEKANLFNREFGQNGVIDNNIAPPVNFETRTDVQCCDVGFDKDEVFSILSNLKQGHAVGPEGYSAFFYKQAGGS